MSKFYLNNIWLCIVLFAVIVQGEDYDSVDEAEDYIVVNGERIHGPEDLPSEKDCDGLDKGDCRSVHSTGGACKWTVDNKCIFNKADTQSLADHNGGNGMSTGDQPGDMYQGDIAITEDNMELVVGTGEDSSSDSEETATMRRSLVNGVQLFPDQTVTWYFDSGYTGSKKAVKDAIFELNEDTGGCLKFKEVAANFEGPAIRVHNENSGSCHVDYIGAPLDRQGKRVNMNLGWCGKEQYIGSIQHEFIHALGFYHEQSRTDRDHYIDIHWEKIEDSWKSQWNKKTNTNTQNLEYDYTSVMHYSPSGGQYTTKDSRFQNIVGQRSYISDLDIRGLQLLYKCEVTVFSGNIRLGGNKSWCLYDDEDSGKVAMRECNKKYEGDSIGYGLNHHWTYNKSTGQIRAMFGASRSGVGKCLRNDGTTSGSGASLTNCNEADKTQQWALGDGKLQNKNSKLCLTAIRLEKDAGLTVETCGERLSDFEMKEYNKFTDTDYVPTKNPTPSGKYKFATINTNTCSGTGKVVTSADSCKEAATDHGLKYQRSGNFGTGYPKGCWKYGSSSVYHNTNSSGGKHSSATPICVTCENCTPSPTNTKAPTNTPKPTNTPAPTVEKTASPTSARLYVLGTKNTNTCEGVGKRVSTVTECKAGAKELGWTFRSTYSSGSYPKGCWRYGSSSVYFSEHATGGKNSNSTPICKKCTNCTKSPTTKKPTASGTYGLATKGTNSCSGIGTFVTSLNECKTAAASFRYSFKSTYSSSSYPKGCWRYGSSSVYFSEHATGGTNSNSTPICKKCSNCTPSPTVKASYATSFSNTCPSGSRYLTSVSECSAAATHYKLTYRSSGNYCTYPKGCFKYYSYAYHNSHYKGKANSNSNVEIICKKLGPTAAPTARADGFIDGKAGKCVTLTGGNPKHQYFGGIGYASCLAKCVANNSCYGYSVSSYNNCLLWLEKVKAGGAQWGQAKCHYRERIAGAPTKAPVSAAPTSAAPTSQAPTSAAPSPAPTVEETDNPVEAPTAAPTRKVEIEGSTSTGFITKSNVNACPNNSSSVEHRSDCLAAAKKISADFVGGIIQEKYPHGCFIYNDKYVFFNGHKGASESNSAVICAETTDNKRRAQIGWDNEPRESSHSDVEALLMNLHTLN